MALVGGQVTKVENTGHLVAAVVLAFSSDPFVRWLLPDPTQFVTYFTQLTRLHGERTGPAGGAYALADGHGAAFWYPPGVHPDSQALGAVWEDAGIVERVSSLWEQVAAYEPTQPHWYLRQIGVDPVLQRTGSGATLLGAGLADIDRRRELSYLEATSPGSRTFYQRHGFVVLGEVQVGDSAPLWPMVREPG